MKAKTFCYITFAIFSSFIIYIFAQKIKDSNENPHDMRSGIISNELCGQLGNQMFGIAATLAYAWDHNLKPIFPALNSTKNNMRYNRDHIFIRLDTSESPVSLKKYKTINPGFVHLPQNLRETCLTGGYFSWRYFDHYRNDIRQVFAPSKKTLSNLRTKYKDLINSKNTVSVHVRTYSKKVHEEGLHFVGLNYFEDTLSKFPPDSIFVIFSDRINWCKSNFPRRFPNKKFIFIEGNDHIEDFFLMSMMKHHILSKSTFSWWAAYLNPYQDKKVYVPVLRENTLRGYLKPYAKSILTFFGKTFWWDENFWLPEWNKIYYSVEVFPDDIYDYGDVTTSVSPNDI